MFDFQPAYRIDGVFAGGATWSAASRSLSLSCRRTPCGAAPDTLFASANLHHPLASSRETVA